MRFGILGPLQILAPTGPVQPPGCRCRTLLIALLAHANEVVSIDKLADWIWPDDPPRSPVNTLHAYVSLLRGALEPQRRPRAPSGLLVTRRWGYLLRVTPESLDTLHFEQLVERGARALRCGDADRAASLLRTALDLWRGEALCDVAHLEAARGQIASLGELRLTATVLRIEADIALDRHLEIVPELTRLIIVYPLHERFYAQLMVALAGSGRRADALAVYDRARAVLGRELGVPPGPLLRRVRTAITTEREDPAAVLAFAPRPVDPDLPVRDTLFG